MVKGMRAVDGDLSWRPDNASEKSMQARRQRELSSLEKLPNEELSYAPGVRVRFLYEKNGKYEHLANVTMGTYTPEIHFNPELRERYERERARYEMFGSARTLPLDGVEDALDALLVEYEQTPDNFLEKLVNL
jgi:hypothetical protein